MIEHLPGCSCCGAPLDATDLDIRSELPDALADLPPEQRAAAWGNKDFQRLEGVGGFLRCLMPVSLTGGSTVTYSVWVSLDDDQLRHALNVWNEPAYADLAVRGSVANAIKPWPTLLGEPAGAVVRDADKLPYLVADESTLLSRVLNDEWDRDDVLSRIWHPLPLTVRQPVTEDWSIERTAGLTPHLTEELMIFAGPGRTVHIETFGTPPGTTADDAIAVMTEGAPEQRDGELTERDGDFVRHAFWLPAVVNGKVQHELHGYAAKPSAVACVTCMYDDPDDLDWAQSVWRSTRS